MLASSPPGAAHRPPPIECLVLRSRTKSSDGNEGRDPVGAFKAGMSASMTDRTSALCPTRVESGHFVDQLIGMPANKDIVDLFGRTLDEVDDREETGRPYEEAEFE
jgi:hypothetical protein